MFIYQPPRAIASPIEAPGVTVTVASPLEGGVTVHAVPLDDA